MLKDLKYWFIFRAPLILCAFGKHRYAIRVYFRGNKMYKDKLWECQFCRITKVRK